MWGCGWRTAGCGASKLWALVKQSLSMAPRNDESRGSVYVAPEPIHSLHLALMHFTTTEPKAWVFTHTGTGALGNSSSVAKTALGTFAFFYMKKRKQQGPAFVKKKKTYFGTLVKPSPLTCGRSHYFVLITPLYGSSPRGKTKHTLKSKDRTLTQVSECLLCLSGLFFFSKRANKNKSNDVFQKEMTH